VLIMDRYRVRYKKKGTLKYISHLDLINYFSRLMVRTDVSVEFTQGYNPKVKFEFGPALPVGFESDCEYFNMYPKEKYDVKKLQDILNSRSLPNLEIKDIKDVENRKLSRTIDGFKFKIKISKKDNEINIESIKKLINISHLETGEFLKKGFIINIDIVSETEDELIIDWGTKFINGQYASPKSITKLEEFKDFYMDCNKYEVMWKSFEN